MFPKPMTNKPPSRSPALLSLRGEEREMPMTLGAPEGGQAGGGSPREEMKAWLAEARALPADEAKLAEQALAALSVTVRAGRLGRAETAQSEEGAGGATITVVGSWKLADAQRLVSSAVAGSGVVVRGVGLLEFCAKNPDRRDLLTRLEPQCILNVALRDEIVCFSGYESAEKAALAFKVEVCAVFALFCSSSPCVTGFCVCLVRGVCVHLCVVFVLVTLTSRFLKYGAFTLQAMGGHVIRDLRDNVTVVVARDLTSDKCKLALKCAAERSQEICVVYPSWLDDCVQHQRRVDPKLCDECCERHPDHANKPADANYTCKGRYKYVPVSASASAMYDNLCMITYMHAYTHLQVLDPGFDNGGGKEVCARLCEHHGLQLQ